MASVPSFVLRDCGAQSIGNSALQLIQLARMQQLRCTSLSCLIALFQQRYLCSIVHVTRNSPLGEHASPWQCVKKFEAVTLCLELHPYLPDLPALNRDDHAVGESWSGKKLVQDLKQISSFKKCSCISHRGVTETCDFCRASSFTLRTTAKPIEA